MIDDEQLIEVYITAFEATFPPLDAAREAGLRAVARAAANEALEKAIEICDAHSNLEMVTDLIRALKAKLE